VGARNKQSSELNASCLVFEGIGDSSRTYATNPLASDLKDGDQSGDVRGIEKVVAVGY
jgi:hypothetical protein